MFPPSNIGHVAVAIPRAFAEVSLAATVTTTLPTHQRPTIPALKPHIGSNPTPSIDAVIVTMLPSATSGPSTTPNPDPGTDKGECRLLGSFAVLVQLALGGLALLSLVYKRWRERPQRPVKIWFFDVSKQVFGSVLVHGANVFMSLLTSGRFDIKTDPIAVGHVARRTVMVLMRRGDEYTPNPCSFYLLNLAIDTTIGIPILIGLVRLTTKLVSYTPLGQPPESIQSGYYGNPPNAWWWLKQSIIYFFGLFGMKICVLIMFLALPWIERIGDWALGWTEGNEQLQIVFVMMLFPLIMNALQYYIIDSFIKKATVFPDDGTEIVTDAAAAERGTYAELAIGEEGLDSDDSGDDGDDIRKTRPESVRLARRDGSKDREYDPAVDGDSQTVVMGSSSGGATPSVTVTLEGERGRSLPKELYPPE